MPHISKGEPFFGLWHQNILWDNNSQSKSNTISTGNHTKLCPRQDGIFKGKLVGDKYIFEEADVHENWSKLSTCKGESTIKHPKKSCTNSSRKHQGYNLL